MSRKFVSLEKKCALCTFFRIFSVSSLFFCIHFFLIPVFYHFPSLPCLLRVILNISITPYFQFQDMSLYVKLRICAQISLYLISLVANKLWGQNESRYTRIYLCGILNEAGKKYIILL